MILGDQDTAWANVDVEGQQGPSALRWEGNIGITDGVAYPGG